MEQDKLDEATERFTKEYRGRQIWVEGLDVPGSLVTITNSGRTDPAAFGATHPAILLEATAIRPKNPMHARPKGDPNVVNLPKKYENIVVVTKPKV